jgi:hypothetical protein
MIQPRRSTPVGVTPLQAHPAGWYALESGGSVLWDGDGWIDYVAPPRPSVTVWPSGALSATVAGLVPLVFIVLVMTGVLLLPL